MTDPMPLEERRKRVVELSAQGMTIRDMADAFGVHRSAIVRDRKTLGLAGQRKTDLSDAEIETARRLLDDGASYVEVGRTLGRAASTISNHFPGRGWTFKEGAQFDLYLRHHGGKRC